MVLSPSSATRFEFHRFRASRNLETACWIRKAAGPVQRQEQTGGYEMQKIKFPLPPFYLMRDAVSSSWGIRGVMEMAGHLRARLISHNGAGSWRPGQQGPVFFYVFRSHGTGLRARAETPTHRTPVRTELS